MARFVRFRPVLLAGAFLAAAFVAGRSEAAGSAGSLGEFSHPSDLGTVAHPVAAAYDAATRTYTIGAGGGDFWAAEDDGGFVWTRMNGDVAIAADIGFLSASVQIKRKACIMIRQSLAPDSAYADVAVHADGLIALQFRHEAGGPTREIGSPRPAPRRVRLEKRGRYVTLSVAGDDGVLRPSGCAVRLSFDGPFYIGLAVCAHDAAGFMTAKFSGVEVGPPPPLAPGGASALETLDVSSLYRQVVYAAPGRMEAPIFSPDGSALYFDRGGRMYRLDLAGRAPPAAIETGSLSHCNDDHGLSPDGSRFVLSDYTGGGLSLMYFLPVGGGAPQRIEVPGPAYWHSWSPDGQTILYCAARRGNYDVYALSVDGGEEKRLTTAPGNDNGPDYTPDGRWIYFHSNRTGRMQIWRMRADGSDQEQVTADAYWNWFPHPSPDGRWIVFFSSRTAPVTGHPPDAEYLLRLMPAAGGAPREIARFFGGNGSLNVPCWSRDSARLAYATYQPAP